METVTLVTFKVKGLFSPIKMALKMAPSQEQIYKKILGIMKDHNISGEVQFKRLVQDKGKKMYIYHIGETKCVVMIEKLQKVIEFQEIE
ncbi:hypothetical protein RCG23_00875 [Neobacillus sp. PS3-34]|uniref:hypothetical protein n=1 Tax=Neobacillus sp. PS3-34 TaxID=3070678 RepID=UPI0027E14EDA|nr:hypothetical protein [Neobacillus sp. PS3-34]WML48733.1 hypothetical protein RCG23_00875 [Neobacillus sp. PS3-34]